jgi:hypothetical protein
MDTHPQTCHWAKGALGYHPATEVTGPIHDELRKKFIAFMDEVDYMVPDGPEKTLFRRSVQKGLMWANCAVALTAPVASTK